MRYQLLNDFSTRQEMVLQQSELGHSLFFSKAVRAHLWTWGSDGPGWPNPLACTHVALGGWVVQWMLGTSGPGWSGRRSLEIASVPAEAEFDTESMRS